MDSVGRRTVSDESDPLAKKKKGKDLIAHDFRQKELIPIKILSLVILASKVSS